MKHFGFTTSQKQRLKELDGDDYLDLTFADEGEREKSFNDIARALERKNKEDLLRLLRITRRPTLRKIEREMADTLNHAGFTEVVTPSIISKEFINRMGITESHSLWKQIFWLEQNKCLRPMLAPNLYYIMRNLRRISRPVSIFEVGSCFRKETSGRQHVEEFTMLNAVELAPDKKPMERLEEIIEIILKGIAIPNYRLERAESDVYGETIDVLVEGVEVASAATGPHQLDKYWEIFEPWAGVGFGLERLTMVRKQSKSLGHVSRSFGHLDGACLSVL